jgi:Ca2+-binding EF-hand superfamily protein
MLLDIKQIFQHFNKNNDGKLSKLELGIMLRSFAKNPTEAELQDLVKEIDLMGKQLL